MRNLYHRIRQRVEPLIRRRLEAVSDLGLHSLLRRSNATVAVKWLSLFFYCTVDSRYLELGLIEFCETRSVFLKQKLHFDCFLQPSLALETFLQVQITRSAN